MRLFLSLLATWALLIQGSLSRHLSMLDIQDFVDQLGDEILSHDGLRTPSNPLAGGMHNLGDSVEGDIAADLGDDIPHPVGVHNWAAHLHMGQISGVAVNPDDEPVIFHRGDTVWNQKSFNLKNELNDRTAIPNDTILVLDPDTGDLKSSWGSGLFHMPHGLTIDVQGNTYVTDVGLHQVMRFPAGAETPDLVLGEAFVPGSDEKHFCQPTDVAVSESSGVFFVADGYCNSRIMKYDRTGRLLKIINGHWRVPHSLALFEEEDVLCVADREGHKIDCLKAGLTNPKHADKDETGIEVISYALGVSRPYAIAAKGTALLSVCGKPEVRGITIDTAAETPKILDQWGIEEALTNPHALAISLTGDSVFVAEIDAKKKQNLHKFEVVRSPTFF